MSELLLAGEHTPSIQLSNGWLDIEEDQDYVLENVGRLPYEHVEILGSGMTAVVEKVCHRFTKEVFAKKAIIFTRLRTRHEKEAYFNNEVSIMRELKGQPHVVRLYATYIARTEFGLLLQPAANGNNLERYLSSYLDYFDNFDPSIAGTSKPHISSMTVGIQRAFGCLANGLASIHAQGIRHRDVKPQNILMHDHSVVITDFGSSKNTTQLGHNTTEGEVDFQTRRYSAPELLDGTKRSFDADVYSLGCVYIELLCALSRNIEVDPGLNYAEMMDDIHDTLDTIQVSSHLDFLKAIIKSMTLRERSHRRRIGEVRREILRRSEFCCIPCGKVCEIPEMPTLSFSDWEWDPTHEQYYCEIFDQLNMKVGRKWAGDAPATPSQPMIPSKYAHLPFSVTISTLISLSMTSKLSSAVFMSLGTFAKNKLADLRG